MNSHSTKVPTLAMRNRGWNAPKDGDWLDATNCIIVRPK